MYIFVIIILLYYGINSAGFDIKFGWNTKNCLYFDEKNRYLLSQYYVLYYIIILFITIVLLRGIHKKKWLIRKNVALHIIISSTPHYNNINGREILV